MLKVVKETHHEICPARFLWKKQNYFSFAVMQLFDLQDPNAKFTSQDFWAVCSEALKINQGEVLDSGIPKARAEFLAAGFCFSPNKKPIDKSFTRIQVANQKKTLIVFGNRHWQEFGIAAKMTNPQPFTKIPLSNKQAFGGVGYDLNPLGCGIGIVEPDTPKQSLQSLPENKLDFKDFPQDQPSHAYDTAIEMFSYPLPNIEYPEHLILRKGDRPKPATYYLIPMNNPTRLKKFGTYSYDSIKKTGLYSYADDIDWNYFNNAAEDQWLPEFFQGDEPFIIENMNLDNPLIKGKLPGWRVRCFANQKKANDEIIYQEINLKLDTVWFMPDMMRGVLIWHGMVPVKNLEASDLLTLQIEDEKLGEQPKSINYYEELLKKKTHRDDLKTRKENQASEIAKKKAETLEQAKKKVKELDFFKNEPFKSALKSVQKTLDTMSSSTSDGATAIPTIDAAAQIQQLAATAAPFDAAQASKLVAEVFSKNGLIFDADKSIMENMKALQKNIKKISSQMVKSKQKLSMDKISDPKAHKAEIVKATQKIDELAKIIDNDTLLKKHLANHGLQHNLEQARQQINDAMSKVNIPRIFTREDLENAYAAGESLAGQSLIEIDLSGINLRGANLKGVNFCYCDLSYADLRDANLSTAILGNTNLSFIKANNANFFKATFLNGNLTEADFSDANLSGANFDGTIANRAKFYKANLSQAYISKADWSYVDMQEVEGSHIVISDSKLHQANMNKVNFDSAILNNITFDDILLNDAVMHNAVIQKAIFANLDLVNFTFSHTTINDSKFTKLNIKDANFERAMFYECELSEIIWVSSNLTRLSLFKSQVKQLQFSNNKMLGFTLCLDTQMNNAVFTKCDLTMGTILNSVLYKVTFKRCDLQKTIFNTSQITESHFDCCQANRASFYDTNLTKSEFHWTNLMQASLRQTILIYSAFKNCNLYGVDFYQATTKQTVMTKCLLQNPLPPNFEESFIHG